MEISLKDVTVTYPFDKKNDLVALNQVTETFPDGKISVILGPSGCGKSTLLKVIAGVLPYEGEIFFDEVEASQIKSQNRGCEYVSQKVDLYPKMTIYDNIAFPLLPLRLPREVMDGKVKELASEFGIFHCLTRLPKQISFGQCQRASICKALIKESKAVLFDEPLSGIDKTRKEEILSYLLKYQAKKKTTFLYVTHDSAEAFKLSDRIYVMKKASFLFAGSKEEALHCPDSEVKEILQQSE